MFNYWVSPPPKRLSSWERSHIPYQPALLKTIFLFPMTYILVPWRVNLHSFSKKSISFNTAPLTTVTGPSPGHGIATTGAKKLRPPSKNYHQALPSNVSFDFGICLGQIKFLQVLWAETNPNLLKGSKLKGGSAIQTKDHVPLDCLNVEKNHKMTRFERFGVFCPQKQKIVKVSQSLCGVTDFPAL